MIFDETIVRIGHGKIVNGYVNNDGTISIFVSTSGNVVEKQFSINNDNSISNIVTNNNYDMNEVIKVASNKKIGKLGRSVKIFN